MEASVTAEGYLNIVMLGQNGEFWPLGLNAQQQDCFQRQAQVFFHMPTTFLSKNSLQGLGFKCIKVTPLL